MTDFRPFLRMRRRPPQGTFFKAVGMFTRVLGFLTHSQLLIASQRYGDSMRECASRYVESYEKFPFLGPKPRDVGDLFRSSSFASEFRKAFFVVAIVLTCLRLPPVFQPLLLMSKAACTMGARGERSFGVLFMTKPFGLKT